MLEAYEVTLIEPSFFEEICLKNDECLDTARGDSFTDGIELFRGVHISKKEGRAGRVGIAVSRDELDI